MMQNMRKLLLGIVALGAFSGNVAFSDDGHKSLTLTMTNDPSQNSIQVYDTTTHSLLQTSPTHGKGGVTGNAFGVKQYKNRIFAVVNNGSNSVSVFEREDDELVLKKTVDTTSPPVSIDFGNNHMYVAGATTVDSFSLDCDFKRDGTAFLILSGVGTPPAGSTSQVGVVREKLLVTLKNDPTPGTVDIVSLDEDGAVSGGVVPVAGPSGTKTPFGFTVFEDGTALITLAHSSNLGLFRNGTFVDVISSTQNAPCWATRAGKYAFIINTTSQTVSRIVTTGQNIFVDAAVAASIGSGNPTDAYFNDGTLAVIDHSSTSHLNFFSVNEFGELAVEGSPVDLGVPNANGVAIMAP